MTNRDHEKIVERVLKELNKRISNPLEKADFVNTLNGLLLDKVEDDLLRHGIIKEKKAKNNDNPSPV